ncbi:MAG: hypothetical protein ACR2K5_06410 [Pseudolabrys sp.]
MPAQAEVVYPPGLRVGLDPPPGMKIDTSTGRFEDPDHKASITIIDLPPRLYPEMEKLVLADTSKPGVTVLKRESFPYASGIGFLVAVKLTSEGKTYLKWILLASAAVSPISDVAAVVSMQVPEDAANVYSDSVARATLASVTIRPIPTEERLNLLPFVLSDLGGFKVNQIAPTGVTLGDPQEPNGLPRIMVSMGPGGPENPDDRARFARDLIQNLPLGDLEIVSAEPMRIRGITGFEIQARGKDPAIGKVRLVQWLRFDRGRYLLMVAGARAEDWDRFYPRFRELRDGIDQR